jgi:SAM-dependent methyltransferase
VLDSILDRELPRAGIPRPRILAVGCGPAEGLGWLASRGDVVGMDVDPAFAPAPRSGTGAVADVPVFLRASAASLPFARASMNVVLALDVIEHLDDDAGALREMARVAAPGARLLVTVPAMPSLWGPHDEVNHHRRRYTRPMMLAAFARAGVEVAWCSYFNSILFPPIAAVRWSQRMGKMRGEARAESRDVPPRSDFDARPPRVIAAGLETVLSFERHFVGRVPFPPGVSLVAVARF